MNRFPQRFRALAGLLIVAGSSAFVLPAAAQFADYQISWWTADGGGYMFSTGGTYGLGGTIGQPDAGVMTAGQYKVQGGFWAGARSRLGDLNCDGVVNNFDIDPFVLAITDPNGYKNTYPFCDIMLADCNEDGVVNNFDIDPFVKLLTGP